MKKALISKEYLTCDESDTLTSVIGKMDSHGIKTVLVYRGKKFVGILDPHQILRIHTSMGTKVKKAARSVKRVPLSTPEKQLAQDLLDNNCHALPVFEKSKLIGVVNSIDVVESLLSASLAKRALNIIATIRPVYFYEDTPILRALPLLRTHHIDHAPIVDTKLRLTGIVSITDLLLRYYSVPQKRAGGKHIARPKSHIDKKSPSGAVTIGSISTRLVATVKLTDPIKKAVSDMKRNHISSLVITDKNHLVGIVTITDLLRTVI